MVGKIVLFTTMKNEGPFMLEWVAYHLSLGIDHILIFTNDCADGTDLIAQRLEAMGVATHVDNSVKEGGNPQHQMLRRARRHPEVQSAEWLLCLDVDEFWNIKTGDGGFRDLINAIETKAGKTVDAISFAWKLFGTSANVCYVDAPVTRQFVLGDNADTYHSGRAFGLKTLFRNNGKLPRFGPHRPKGADPETEDQIAWSDASGNLLPAKDVGWRAWPGFDHSFGRIHHYSVRSVESFLVKRDRGRTNHINVDQSQIYWRDMNANHTPDLSILPKAAAADGALAELMNDPVLADLHNKAVGWHRDKIQDLKAREDWAEFRDWLGNNLLQCDGI